LTFNIQGKVALKKHLEMNPDILNALQPHLLPTKDDQEMDNIQSELEAIGVDNLNGEQKEQLREIRKMKGLSTEDIGFTAEEQQSLAELDMITSGSAATPGEDVEAQ
jgi:hypothetical protein